MAYKMLTSLCRKSKLQPIPFLLPCVLTNIYYPENIKCF